VLVARSPGRSAPAERIIEWLRFRAVGPAIVELRGFAENIRAAEMRRSAARLKGLTPCASAGSHQATVGL
jgi:hypothetical protein